MISPTTRRSAIPVSTAAARRPAGVHNSALNGRRSLSRSKDTLLDHCADRKPSSYTNVETVLPTTSPTQQQLATDADLRTFTLLEENIALKESVEQLDRLRTEQQQLHATLLAQLTAVRSQCEQLHRSEANRRAQVQQERERDEQPKLNNAETTAAADELVAHKAAAAAAEAAVRAQLASTELQLYEANEKCADLTEENGRLHAECESVTTLARLACDEAARTHSGKSSDTLALLRDITAQREIYARVARTSSDSRALLSSVLQLMDTANNTVAKMEMARNVDMQKLAQQQLQQQQQQPQPSPSIDNSRSSMGVGSSDNRSGGRTVQMNPNVSAVHVTTAAYAAALATAVSFERPPPPPVPPRHYNTAHMSGSLGDGRQPQQYQQQQQQQDHHHHHHRFNMFSSQQQNSIPSPTGGFIVDGAAITAASASHVSSSLSRTNGPDINPINSGLLQSQSPQQLPYVLHRPYQAAPMATGMDAMTVPNRRHVIVEATTQQDDTIFV